MTRINVYDYSDTLAGVIPQHVGWFNLDKAEFWTDRDHDSHRGEAVLRTAQGRWVLQRWTDWQDEETQHEYITPEQAQAWLLRHDEDTAVEQYFGAIEEERGPGRPEIGGQVGTVRLGVDRLARVDRWAEANGVVRAEAIRRLIDSGLTGVVL